MDRFEAMSVVLAVAEAGSLSEAARREKNAAGHHQSEGLRT